MLVPNVIMLLALMIALYFVTNKRNKYVEKKVSLLAIPARNRLTWLGRIL